VSGGHNVQDLVGIATESALVSAAFHKLNDSCFPQQMQVALDCSDGTIECLRNGFHLRPAQAGLVV